MTKPNLICENLTIPHAAFEEALQRIEQCFLFAEQKAETEALAIIGESGTGKTSVLKTFYRKHELPRSDDGLEIPVLLATVPATPTVKSLAATLLAALHDPLPGKGTEFDMTERIKTLMRHTGTRMVMIDEFQHFHDRGKMKVAHNVADWLKRLIDETGTTLVVGGLPSGTAVIDQNEQLGRRSAAPVELKRFDWRVPDDRKQFRNILVTYQKALAKRYDTLDFSSLDVAFRFSVATGGLISYVAKILRQAERAAFVRQATTITLDDLHAAHMQSMWSVHRLKDSPKPFLADFNIGATEDALNRSLEIGKPIEQPISGRSRKRKQTESVDSALVAK